MKKLNLIPILMAGTLVVSAVCFFVFKSKIAAFIAIQMFAVHMSPPFCALGLFLFLHSEKTDELKAEKICRSFLFRQHKWENSFYTTLKVKNWKTKFGTYDKSLFKVDGASLSKTVIVTAQSELVHLVAACLSFVPLFLCQYFSNIPLLIVLCILFSALNLPYIIIQRYNRPRIMRLKGKFSQKD